VIFIAVSVGCRDERILIVAGDDRSAQRTGDLKRHRSLLLS
jgi:hypothetical protein